MMDSDSSRHSSPKKKSHKQLEAEEDEIQDKIIGSLTSKYTELNSYDLLEKTLEHLRENIKPGICLICIENVEKDEAIWSCDKCYCILHLVCIQRWAKDSIANVKEAAAYKGFILPLVWCCPKCRGENTEAKFPQKYKCFCGKVENPRPDGWSVPHSCGETCGKPLKPECGHNCILLCHSGSCPPCPKQIVTSCYCGSSDPKTLRCFSKSWSCGETCSKSLECAEHRCSAICHSGVCRPCTVAVQRSCNCASPKELIYECSQLRSNDIPVSCGNQCGKPLACDAHKCKQICHSEECPNCEQSCPCGKKRIACTGEPNATFGKPCEDTCGKKLDCDEHTCEQKCHAGNCGSCLQLIVKRCKCGQYEKEVLCSKEFACTTKCRRTRDCGVHSCNKKCCAGDCPPCRNPCGKTLQCKNHKCEMICHRGSCYPCPVAAPVKCFCGQTVRYVPCGSEKKCRPPDCSRLCTRSSKCDHPEIQKHKCHFGDCPKCRLVCGKLMPCGHKCPNICHSHKLNRNPCFKCAKLVPSRCVQHPDVLIECSRQYEPCGEICGKLLACRVHNCMKRCHKTTSDDCGDCSEACSKPRAPGCEHECALGCHPGPCQSCTLVAKMPCHCEEQTMFVVCYKQKNLSESEQSCKNQCPKKLSCGHRCLSICHSGECPPLEKCRRKIKVSCRCKVFRKEMECFLIGESKILECSSSTCNLGAKQTTSAGKPKRKPRHKKHSENNDQAANLELEQQTEKSEPSETQNCSLLYCKPVVLAVVAVAVVVTGIVVGLSSENS